MWWRLFIPSALFISLTLWPAKTAHGDIVFLLDGGAHHAPSVERAYAKDRKFFVVHSERHLNPDELDGEVGKAIADFKKKSLRTSYQNVFPANSNYELSRTEWSKKVDQLIHREAATRLDDSARAIAGSAFLVAYLMMDEFFDPGRLWDEDYLRTERESFKRLAGEYTKSQNKADAEIVAAIIEQVREFKGDVRQLGKVNTPNPGAMMQLAEIGNRKFTSLDSIFKEILTQESPEMAIEPEKISTLIAWYCAAAFVKFEFLSEVIELQTSAQLYTQKDLVNRFRMRIKAIPMELLNVHYQGPQFITSIAQSLGEQVRNIVLAPFNDKNLSSL